MNSSNAIAIPEKWYDNATLQQGGLNNQPSFRLLPLPDYEGKTAAEIKKSIEEVLKISGLQTAVIVLPSEFADASYVKYWPNLFLNTGKGPLITSVCFYDEWPGFSDFFKFISGTSSSAGDIINVTCQYQPPYTWTADLWTHAGAKFFHPGDYHKYEFLEELAHMKGHWLYWGHSDCNKLRGYQHLNTCDLLSKRPAEPLQSTLWFSCSTLKCHKHSNIALEWYLSGATCSLLASLKDINTKENQLLSEAWLDVCRSEKVTTLADILYSLLCLNKKTFGPILKNYRLLGSPWIKFKMSSGTEI